MSSRSIAATAAAFAAAAGLALVPGVASAHGDHRDSQRDHHHRHHHARSHHHHHARVKIVASRDPASGAYTDPSAPAGAGQVTIASFSGGRLTLQLADGTVSGRVTDQTRIRCESPSPGASATMRSQGDDDQGDDDSGAGQDRGQATSGRDDRGDDDAGDAQDRGDDDQAATCDHSALVAGAVVSRAKLVISGGVATFHQIEVAGPAS